MPLALLLWSALWSALWPLSGAYVQETIVCEGSTLQLQCVSGQLLDIRHAYYGRTTSTECDTHPTVHDEAKVSTCSSRNLGVTSIVSSLCQDRSTCAVGANNGVMTEPCGGLFKYLRVFYQCKGGSGVPPTTYSLTTSPDVTGYLEATVCQDDLLTLECPMSHMLYVRFAYHGFTDTVCVSGLLGSFTNLADVCTYNRSAVVFDWCHNRTTCQIHTNDPALVTSCSSTYTYLRLFYWCQLELQCPPLPQVANASKVNESEVSVTYQCDEGYLLVSGNLSRHCHVDGNFSGQAPVCLRACPAPPLKVGLSPSPGPYHHGVTVTYLCPNGTNLQEGNTTLTCSHDGSWVTISDGLTCYTLQCPPLPQVSNASKVNESEISVTYQCGEGYLLVSGNLSRHCQVDGNFSGQAPVCLRTCPSPPSIPGLYPSPGPYYQGVTITYHCHYSNASKEDNTTLTCGHDGSWVNVTDLPQSITCIGQGSGPCVCQCHMLGNTLQQRAYVKALIPEIKKNLTLDRRTLSSHQRRLISAQPPVEVSQAALGGVGVTVLVLVFGTILVSDAGMLGCYLLQRAKEMWEKRRGRGVGGAR